MSMLTKLYLIEEVEGIKAEVDRLTAENERLLQQRNHANDVLQPFLAWAQDKARTRDDVLAGTSVSKWVMAEFDRMERALEQKP